MNDYPKSLGNEGVRRERVQLLKSKHILPLVRFVNEIRKERRVTTEVPNFDPLDGGIFAKLMFVLEAPGAKAVQSGFVSRNNPDETARNFFEINKTVGIPRNKTITWNIVPWYIGSGKKIRAANQKDIKYGLTYLHRLLALLPRLKIIVLIGKKAQKIQHELQTNHRDIAILTCPHPIAFAYDAYKEVK